MRLNDADGMANRVDPDQTSPQGAVSSAYTVSSDLSVRKFRNITVCDIFLWNIIVQFINT